MEKYNILEVDYKDKLNLIDDLKQTNGKNKNKHNYSDEIINLENELEEKRSLLKKCNSIITDNDFKINVLELEIKNNNEIINNLNKKID